MCCEIMIFYTGQQFLTPYGVFTILNDVHKNDILARGKFNSINYQQIVVTLSTDFLKKSMQIINFTIINL